MMSLHVDTIHEFTVIHSSFSAQLHEQEYTFCLNHVIIQFLQFSCDICSTKKLKFRGFSRNFYVQTGTKF